MTCAATTSQHDRLRERTYHLYIGGAWGREAVLCDGCLRVYLSLGYDFRSERRAYQRTAA